MNIREITAGQLSPAGRGTAFGAKSFLNIGSKGQVVEGVISQVSDQISINFNGVEVKASASSVQNATEGETRRFRIMDVSKDHIVLKEVGNDDASGSTRAMMGTTVSAGVHSFSDNLNGLKEVSEAKQQADQNIALLTGEDYQSMESEQGALEEYKASALDRAIGHHKEKQQWQQETAEANIEQRNLYREQLEWIQANGFTDQKSRQEVIMALEGAGMPASEGNIDRVLSAMEKASVVPKLSDSARAYLIGSQAVPSIENLYQGQYSGLVPSAADQLDGLVWQQLEDQITGLLEGADGIVADEKTLEQAKWLLVNDLPVTAESLQSLQKLDEIQQEVTPAKVLDQIIIAMQMGAEPEQASLDDTQIVTAQAILQDFAEVSPEDVHEAVQLAGENDITLALLKQASAMKEVPESGTGDRGQDSRDAHAEFMVYRQLEEIRLKMTLQSAMRMAEKGIDVEVAPLKNLVEELRTQEREYLSASVSEDKLDHEQLGLVQETLVKTQDISTAPAQIIGSSVRQQSLLTLNVLHRAAVSAAVQLRQYQTDFEAVSTQADKSYGDSIQKAFANSIPDLLRENGLEDTAENARAIRILGYNRMEVTPENISLVKGMDARVNSVISQMKPGTVLELVRQGQNPLDMPLEELDGRLREIAEKQDVVSEEKYSRFLWRLEQDGNITESEREGYIGVYRLLHQINRSDGAAVGAVMDAGQSMTLGNLLTAVRTNKGPGIDAQIDDDFGGLAETSNTGKSITEQIESGFHRDFNESGERNGRSFQEHAGGESGFQDGQQDSSEEHRQNTPEGRSAASSIGQEYHDRLAGEILDMITPSAMREITDGDMERILDFSLERLKEELQEASGNRQLEKRLYDQLAEQLRETVEHDQEIVQYLESIGVADTISNIQAAGQMLYEGYDIYREMHARKKQFSQDIQKELEDAVAEAPGSLEDAETAAAGFERLEHVMENMMEQAYEAPDITYEDIRNLRSLSRGMVLHSQMVRRHSYDIPFETEDGITSMNVTLIQGTGDAGRVQIYLENAGAAEDGSEAGSISAELKMSGNEVRGLMLSESREMHDRLRAADGDLVRQIQENGFEVKNISYGMDHKSRSEQIAGVSQERIPTVKLYRLAKLTVKHIMSNV